MVGPRRGADRRADLFQRRRHHPCRRGAAGKGAALGTVLAFMMSVIALSLPEMIILRKVLTTRLIAVFVGVVSGGHYGRRLSVQRPVLT